jgi:hypothetical protein
MLLALALGPLSALTFLAMATGKELGNYERQVLAWELKRQQWLDRQRIRLERKEERFRKLSESGKLAGKLLKRTPADWRRLSEEDRDLIAQISASDIVARYAVSERTARNWQKWINNGKAAPD